MRAARRYFTNMRQNQANEMKNGADHALLVKSAPPGAALRQRPAKIKESGEVSVRTEDMVIPTYMPAPPDKNPMFLEKRVYQGSSGKVYPLPFTDRIAEKPVDRKWKAIWIEHEFIRAMVLPEIGGGIYPGAGTDQSGGAIPRPCVSTPTSSRLAQRRGT